MSAFDPKRTFLVALHMSAFGAALAFGWFTDLPDYCSAASRSARSALRARLRPSPQLGVLPLRQPLSSRSWQLRALPPWPLRARPCGRLHAPPSPPPRVARVRQPRSSLAQRLRALPASPPGRAPPSRQLYASLARWLRASPSLPPRASPAARFRAGLSPRRHALLARLRLRDPWPLAWPFQQARRALRPCCLPP